jgi:protein-S-isoprenylcysteine O-methyltransferase Ste14
MIKAIIFVVVSAGFLRISWSSLRRPTSYGFYRFFAFEAILGLTLLNADNWFVDPFSVVHVLSWLLLIGSLLLGILGFRLLHVIGKPEGSIEDTTELVDVGVYRFIRHPLYASLLLFAFGVFFKDVSLLAGIMLAIAFAFMIATARFEELENRDTFGAAYAKYMKCSKMFIPYVF